LPFGTECGNFSFALWQGKIYLKSVFIFSGRPKNWDNFLPKGRPCKPWAVRPKGETIIVTASFLLVIGDLRDDIDNNCQLLQYHYLFPLWGEQPKV
jgi:hypothetical protein